MNVEDFVAKAVRGDTHEAVQILRDELIAIQAKLGTQCRWEAFAMKDAMFDAVLEAVRLSAPDSNRLAALALQSKAILGK